MTCHHSTFFIPEKGKLHHFSLKTLKGYLKNLKISNVAGLLLRKSVKFQKNSLPELILRHSSAQNLTKLPKLQVAKLQRRVNIDRG